MKCFFCQIPVPDDGSSCAACHRELAKACPSCALLYERDANFCMACGGKLSDRYAGAAKTVPPAPVRPAKSAQKKTAAERPRHITLTEIIIPDEPAPNGNGKDIEIDLGSLEESLHRRLAAEHEQEQRPAPTRPPAPSATIPPIDAAPEYDEEDGSAVPEEMSLQASEITFHEPERSLSPYLSHNTYPISLREISDAVTAQIHDPIIPTLFDAIGKRITASNGGFFTIEAPAGTGKGHFTAAVEQFIAQNPLYDANIVISTVNPFDFDYTIFIHLVRSVLNIKTVDQQQVRAKIDKYFADLLPAGKRESLTALLCLNFTPVQVKLPKSDLDYLLAFMCYWSARNKPILWVVDNAGQVNLRSFRLFRNLKKVFAFIPFTVLFVCDQRAQVIELVDYDCRFNFTGTPHEERLAAVRAFLKTPRLPADIEKVLNNPQHNTLYTQELFRLLMGRGFIFDMRGSWRFQKLPDDLVIPDDTEELVLMRYRDLPPSAALLLRRLVMLGLYRVPASLLGILVGSSRGDLDLLVSREYVVIDNDACRFLSRAVVHILKRTFKIEPDDRKFYRDIVSHLAAVSDIPDANRHWLLLSYLNLGGITERKYNSFLYSSAIYMEKLGFFELAQRCYQSILSSFGKNQEDKRFALYLELKNAKLWGFSDPSWARLFWQTMLNTAKNEGLLHIQLISQGELLLLETDKIVIHEIVEIVKQLHKAGCYEDEISLIDRMSDLLLKTSNFSDAKIFASRAFRIMEDIRSRNKDDNDGGDIDPATIIFMRASCKLADVHAALREYPDALQLLQSAMDLAVATNISYFKAKILLSLGKIRMVLGEEWEPLIQDGFAQALQGMDFAIMKAYFLFFEEQGLESRPWVQPHIEYKNWINF